MLYRYAHRQASIPSFLPFSNLWLYDAFYLVLAAIGQEDILPFGPAQIEFLQIEQWKTPWLVRLYRELYYPGI